MNDNIEISNSKLSTETNRLLFGIETLIQNTSRNVAVYLNAEISRLYWAIGNYIVSEMQYETYSQRGQQILATLSRTLTEKFGKGYTHSALTRMIKVAEAYDERRGCPKSRSAFFFILCCYAVNFFFQSAVRFLLRSKTQ